MSCWGAEGPSNNLAPPGLLVDTDSGLTASRWDEEYRNQRYADEPPLRFVSTIIDVLRADPAAWSGSGLYVGCGNGRNYLPLLDAGLDLFGVDVSPEALRRLVQRRPTLPSRRLRCEDFRTFESRDACFDYVIAIQVFQHGDDTAVAAHLDKAATLLRPGGLLFLRINSISTDIYHAHTVVDRNAWGGITVRYEEGPKSGLLVHFASRAELLERLRGAFILVMEPREDVTVRRPPQTGAWAQWEAIWKRREPEGRNDRLPKE
jgi:SAM-dependent methyltransferase